MEKYLYMLVIGSLVGSMVSGGTVWVVCLVLARAKRRQAQMDELIFNENRDVRF